MEKSKKSICTEKIHELFLHSFSPLGKLRLGVVLMNSSSPKDKWHRHNGFFEIVVCCSGSAEYEDENGSIMLHPGNVLLLYPGTVHRYNRIRSFRYYNLLFGEEFFAENSQIFMRETGQELFPGGVTLARRHLGESELTEMISILEAVRYEWISRKIGWESAMLAEGIRALTFLRRHAIPDEGKIGSGAFQIGKAIRYMESAVQQGVNVKEAAVFVNMSESSFRHRFRELTGISPMEYMLQLRIRKAVMALAGNMSVNNASEVSGFKDVNYFCRQFKKRFGLTPMQFRNQVINGIIDPAEALERSEM